jgi:sialate O-acetylesterase
MARRWEQARDPLHLKLESPDLVHGGRSLSVEAAQKLRRKARKGAGVGLHFGRLMQAQTGVPQGLIATAHGGTTMAQWDPALRHRGGDSLYGSMLLSLRAVDQPLAGVLWYQGESEALPKLARVYTSRMRRLIGAVRRDLGQPNLPWLMVQIGRFIRGPQWSDPWPNSTAWNAIQEQQRLLPNSVSRCRVVPAIDLELDDLAHIGSDGFALLGKRLAEITMQLIFRDPKAKPPIALRSIRQIDPRPAYGPRIEMKFANVVGRLSGAGPIHGFTLIDAKGLPVSLIHRVRLDGDRIVVHLIKPAAKGLRLRYGFGLDPDCRIVDSRSMAVPAFGPVAI